MYATLDAASDITFLLYLPFLSTEANRIAIFRRGIITFLKYANPLSMVLYPILGPISPVLTPGSNV